MKTSLRLAWEKIAVERTEADFLKIRGGWQGERFRLRLGSLFLSSQIRRSRRSPQRQSGRAALGARGLSVALACACAVASLAPSPVRCQAALCLQRGDDCQELELLHRETVAFLIAFAARLALASATFGAGIFSRGSPGRN